jgi:hypothetical protein
MDEARLFWGCVEDAIEKGLGMWVMDGETLACAC